MGSTSSIWSALLPDAEFAEPSPSALPWNTESLRRSPPLGALNWMAGWGDQPLAVYAKGFARARKVSERVHWAQACVGVALSGGFLENIPSASFRAWAAELRSDARFSGRARWMVADRVKYLELLNALGDRRLEVERTSQEDCLEAFAKDPRRAGLLFLASLPWRMNLLCPFWGEAGAQLDQILRQESFDSDLIRADAAIVRVLLGRLAQSEVPALVRHLATQTEQEPALWPRFFSAIRLGGAPAPLRECLLTHSVLPLDAPLTAKQSRIAAIEDTLARRRSGLDDPALWDRLGLPLPRPEVGGARATEAQQLPKEPVVLSRIQLDGTRILENMILEFAPPEPDAGQWILLIGENGVGKSTVLRSIVLALRDLQNPKLSPKGTFASPWRAGGLPTSREGRIHLTLPAWGEFLTTIRQNGTESFQQTRPEPRNSRILPLFAYGCRRSSALGGASRAVDLSEDDGPEIASLFDESAALIHAETWLKEWHGERDAHHRKVFDSVRQALLRVLDLESLEIKGRQVLVSGHAVGKDVPFAALSDGYLTPAGWFLDLLARWIELAHRNKIDIDANFTQRMTGMVLLDEIDLHLHPRWQIEVITRVKALLPRMSFVMSTHNPLTLVGARPEEIWVLTSEDGRIRAQQRNDPPMLLTGGQIYTQYFGIKSLYPREIGEKLRRYGFLSSYSARNDEEQAELEGLRKDLQDARVEPGWEEVPRKSRPGASNKTTRKRSS